jgi:hypothetical protein
MREDFPENTKEVLARRAGMQCSNPACRQLTSGPQVDPKKAINIGVAAHLTAASAGGARYDANLSPLQRSSIENGIWLCQNCAKLIDNDPNRYTLHLLLKWKELAEQTAHLAVKGEQPNPNYKRRRVGLKAPAAILASLIIVVLLRVALEIQRYTKGGTHPAIKVEPYFGPTDGIRRTLATSPEKPGFLAVLLENDNPFPIYDLELAMVDLTPSGRSSETMERFNEEMPSQLAKTRTFHPNKMISVLLPANPNCNFVDLQFNAKTRAADTLYRFRLRAISNRWEFATTITDVKTGKIRSTEKSSKYPLPAVRSDQEH